MTSEAFAKLFASLTCLLVLLQYSSVKVIGWVLWCVLTLQLLVKTSVIDRQIILSEPYWHYSNIVQLEDVLKVP